MHFDRARPLGLTATCLRVLVLSAFVAVTTLVPAGAEEPANPFQSMLDAFSVQPAKDDESIDYRPRAPLVVPPTRDLPEPRQAVRDPAWPKEPDAEKRRRAAIDSRRPAPKPIATGDAEPEAPPLEVAVPAKPAEQPDGCVLNGTGPDSCWNLFQSAVGGGETEAPKPGAEPTRKLLTEPPAGYRTAVVVPEKNVEAEEAQHGPFDSFLQILGVKKAHEN